MRRYVKYLIAGFILLISVWLILLRAQYSGVAVNHWTPTADMAYARAAACSALLPDGRVLVAGGNSSSGVVNTAELYGTNGTFTLAAPMTQARAGAACTTMQNGSVLVTGGTDGTSALASAEIYDPVMDAWTPAGAMAVARTGHTARLTPWGAVLIVGGQSNGSVSSVVEMFLLNGQFLTVGNLSSPRANYALAVLPGHKVLIAGGSDGNSALNTIDLFNADNDSITPAGTMLVARTNFAMSPLLDGTVLITGGYGASGNVLASSEIYDPVKQVSTDGPQLPVSRANHQSYLLTNNGQVMLAGGVTDGAQALTDTDVYQPWTSRFAKTAPMNTARSGDASSLLQRGSLIVAGGRNGNGYLTSSEVYGFATIQTDKSDYAPGTPVVMSGSGWVPGEQVLVQVTAFPIDQHSVEFTGAAVADGTGQITLTGFQVDKSHLGMKFLANATGSQSQAQTLFSDSDTTSIAVAVTPASPTGYPVALEITGTVSNFTDPAEEPGSPSTVTFEIDGNPAGSGVTLGACSLCASNGFDSGSNLYNLTALGPGVHSVQVAYGGGTCGTDTCLASSYSFNYTVNPLNTAISNIGNTNPSFTYGGTSTLSAEVDASGPGSGTFYPAGTLTFNDGIGTVLTCSLPVAPPASNHCSQATPVTLPVGIHNFATSYSGNNTQFYASSGGTTTVTVSAVTTTTSLTTTAPSPTSPQPYGTAVTFTATVTPSTAAGTVSFFSDSTQIGSAQTLVAGVATITTSTLPVGTHSITASYSPSSGNFLTSTAPGVSYQITGDTTTTVFTGAGTPPSSSGTFGSNVAFVVQVTNNTAPGTANPTGTITLKDVSLSNAVVGTGTLTAGAPGVSAVTINVSNLQCNNCYTAGTFTHDIRAFYTPGTTNFNASDTSTTNDYSYIETPALFTENGGAALPFVVTVNPTGVTLGTAFTVTVTAPTPYLGGIAPTGGVIIYFGNNDGAGNIVPLNNGVATATYTPMSVSQYNLLTLPSTQVSVTYGGDNNYNFYLYNDSTAGYYFNLGVTQAPTAGTMSSTPTTPITYGYSVTYVLNVTSAYPGSISGGTAAFLDGVTAIASCATQPLSNGQATCQIPLPAVGAHSITATWNGNPTFANGTSSAYVLTVNPEPTTVALTPSATNTTLTSSVTYTAVVSGTPVTPVGTGAATFGFVYFQDLNGPVTLCNNVAVSVAGVASCTVNYNGGLDLGAGTHNVQAFYVPPSAGTYANDFAASSSAPVSVVVAPVVPTISAVTSSATTSYNYGTPTNLSVTLTPGNPTPAYTGNVQFFDGLTSLGYGTQVSAGSTTTYTLSNQILTGGAHNIRAEFLGDTADSNYSASLSTPTLNITVNKFTPTVAVPGSPFSEVFASTFSSGTVTVTGAGGAAASPTGTVTVSSSATASPITGTGTLAAGATTFNITLPLALTVTGGLQNLTFTYNGDTNYNSVTFSGSITLTKATAGVAVTVTNPTAGTPVYGQPVTLTATFTGATGDTVTGTVNFAEAGTLCATVTISSGRATCTVPNGTPTATFSVGAHTVTVNSLISGNYSLTGSPVPATFSVLPANTTTTISANPNPSIPGQSVTYTATVAVNSPGADVITGNTVNFQVDSGAIVAGSPLALVNGVETSTYTTTFNSANPSSHVISATYAGDVNTNTSFASLTQNLSKPLPVITITLTPIGTVPGNSNPSVYGQTVGFTATLTFPAGGPVPNGTVQFYDGSNTLGGLQALSLVSGTTYAATILIPSGSIPVLAGGTHPISATYIPGNSDNYGQSSSLTQAVPSVLQQQVNRANSLTTSFTVVATPSTVVYGETVALSVYVTPTGTNIGTPTGTVQFFDSGTPIGGPQSLIFPGTCPNTPANGPWPCATLSISSLSVGPHASVTATYSGDQNFNGSSTGNNAVPVVADPTLTVLGAFPSTPQYGGQITLTAKVCGLAPGSLITCASTLPSGPVSTISFYDGATLLGTSSAVDATGTASITIIMVNPPFATPVVGGHSITAHYNGGVGGGDPNFAPSTSAAATLTIAKGPTTTSVVSSVTPSSVYSQPVTFTATVASPGSVGSLPSGTVTFIDGSTSTTLGTATLVNSGGSAVATLTLPNGTGGLSLAVGNHAISVTYSGDTSYATSTTPSGSPLVQTVVKANTTSILSTSCSTSAGCVVGQPVTLTASVTVNAPGVNAPISGTTAAPTGTIQFFNGSTVLGSAPASLLVTGGSAASPTYTATLTTTLPEGNLQLKAVYSGDGSYNTSTSAILTQGINTIAVNVVVTGSQSSVTYGTPVQFTVTVTPVNTSPPPVSGTLPIPTGIVTFFDGSSALCSGVQLGGGTATCNPAGPLAVGTHSIGVTYTPTQDQTGNVDFQPNVSSTIALVVNKIPTSLSLTSNFTQGYAGQPITLTAQVVANPASGVPYAGGQVQFFDGSFQSVTNLLGVANLASGTGVLQPSVNLAPGLHQIFAVYGGDNYYTGSQSGYDAVTVNVAATSTTIASSVNPSVVGQTVVFTITVGVTYPSTFGANGQVQLYDNQVALGSPVSANNGTFTITVPGLTPGTNNIYAVFLSNTNFSTSTSPTLTQIVNPAPTVTTLAALPVSSTSSQQVVLTAVVNVPAPGAGNPTGTVQFVDTTFNKILGTAPLTMIGGVYTATITTDQLVQSGAPQLLTATYSGDANFATSTSTPQGQTVFGSQITVTSAASYYSSNFAPDSWATAWGIDLSTSTLQSSTTPLPTSLAGTTVQVTDAAGVQRLAALSFVSSGQINFMIPTNTASGLATVTVTNAFGATASTIIVVSPTSPGLFSQDSTGTGLAAGQYIVVHADGSQTNPAQIAQYNSTTGQWVPVPIAAGATDQVFLVLYGTGIRYKPSNSSVTATVNGQSVTVSYAGPQAQYAGEDQVNLGPLPSFKGAGVVPVKITVNGEPSNTVTVDFQ